MIEKQVIPSSIGNIPYEQTPTNTCVGVYKEVYRGKPLVTFNYWEVFRYDAGIRLQSEATGCQSPGRGNRPCSEPLWFGFFRFGLQEGRDDRDQDAA